MTVAAADKSPSRRAIAVNSISVSSYRSRRYGPTDAAAHAWFIHHAELTGQGLAILFVPFRSAYPQSVGEHDEAARVANGGGFIEATKVRALCRGGPMTKIGIAARQGG
jgi:hypothetical protein